MKGGGDAWTSGPMLQSVLYLKGNWEEAEVRSDHICDFKTSDLVALGGMKKKEHANVKEIFRRLTQ